MKKIFAILAATSSLFAGEVLPNGSYSHSIEIQVPPGTNGMQPKLSLSYNSNGGNGMVGMGWSLQGLPSISRINNGSGINYAGGDTYAGSGGKLVDITGGRTLFHTENESFSKYEPVYNGSCVPVAFEPCSWIVTDASGMVMEFGATSDSRAVGPNGTVRSWLLNKVRDLNGNYYTVQYITDANEIYPERIIYTQNDQGGISRYRTVEFLYDNSRTDHTQSFATGVGVDTRYRLNGIRVMSGVMSIAGYLIPLTGDLVRRYSLNYDYGTTGRSRLVMFKEFGSDNATSLPASFFSYQNGDLNGSFEPQQCNAGNGVGTISPIRSNTLTADFNGDGKADIASYAGGQSWCSQRGDGTPFAPQQCNAGDGVGTAGAIAENTVTADFNGDGRADIASYAGGQSWCVQHGNSVSFDAQQCNGGTGVGTISPIASNVFVADFNGDGRADVASFAGGQSWCVQHGNATSFDPQQCNGGNGVGTIAPIGSYALVGDFNGDGKTDIASFAGGQSWCVQHGNATSFDPQQCNGGNGVGTAGVIAENTLVADFNGDGKTDIASFAGGQSWCVQHGNGVTFDPQQCNGGNGVGTVSPIASNVLVADFNGDGRADVASFASGQSWCVQHGNGVTFDPQQCNGGNGVGTVAPIRSNVLVGDFNGDGRADVASFASGQSWCVQHGNLLSFEPQQCNAGNGVGTAAPIAQNTLVADFNGDGKADVASFAGGQSWCVQQGSGNNKFDLLSGSVNSQGGQITINYVPAAHLANAMLSQYSTYPNSVNLSTRQLVTLLTAYDGRGGAYTTSYQYYNGKIRTGTIGQRKDLGFEWVRKTNGTTGVSTVSYFRQDNPDLNYRMWRQDVYNGANQLMLRMDSGYSSNPTIYPGTYFVAQNQQQISAYEAGNLLHVRTRDFTYDNYGNQIQIMESASGTETIQTTTTFAIDTMQNILRRKIEAKQVWEPGTNNTVISWMRFIYAGNNVASEEKYLDTSGSWLKTYYTHDIYGNVTSITDPRGLAAGDPAYTTVMQYDADYHALRIQMTNPLGHTEKARYDNLAINIVEEEDANGNIQRNEYDAFGRLTKIIEPGDGSIGVGYTKQILFVNEGNPNAQYMEVRYADNSGTGYRFERTYADGLDRIYREEKKGYTEVDAGTSTTYTIETQYEFFDETQNIRRQSKPYIVGKQTPIFETIVYDNYARPLQQITTDGYTVDFAYNAGCPAFTTCSVKEDAMGYVYKVATDARGRVVRREDPEGGLVRHEFLPLQDKTYDAGGSVVIMFYDTLNRNTSMLDRNTGSWIYQRDNVGNMTQQLGPNGKIIQMAYDSLNRMLSKSYPGNTTGEVNVTYDYDNTSIANGKGRVTRITDASGQTIFGYEAKGNITSWVKTLPDISGSGNISVGFSAEYDQQKRIKKLIYPDGSAVTQFYADAGYLRQVRLLSPGGFFGSPVVTYEGPDLNQQFIRKTGNNVVEKIGYDPAVHRPTSVETVLPTAASVRKLRYTYDGNGNTLSITDLLNAGAKTETFTYDGLNRITSATGAYGYKAYAHDARGRLITKDNTTQSFGDANHPEAVTNGAEGAYAHDAVGNLTQRLSRQYIFDSENRLKEIKLGTTTKQNFVYDSSGMRAMKIRDDGAKIYYFGGLKNYGALYEIAIAPGSSVPQHTKYIYGLNSDRAAQVTVPNANLVSYSVNTENALAAIHGGSFTGTLISMYHTSSAYLIVASNVQRDLRVIFYLSAIGILGVYLFRAFRRYGHKPESEIAEQKGWIFHTAPLMLITFTCFYGVGCTSQPSGPSDAFPGSGDVAAAPPVGAPNADNSAKGFPANGTFFFHPNHVGSLNFITNTLGTVVSEFGYLPYGELDLPRSSGPDIARYKFATYERDAESGLDNANARMYNSQSGTFASPDTIIPGDGARSQGLNRYMYTEGNPVKFNDPTGHALGCDRDSIEAEGKEGGCISTFPGHNYSGFTKKFAGFDHWPATAQDAISMYHDSKHAQFLKNKLTQKQRRETIWADSAYIVLTKILQSVPIVGKVYNLASAATDSKAGFFGALILAAFYDLADTIVGAIAIVAFTANIAYQTTQYVSEALGVSKPTADVLSAAAAGAAVCGLPCAAGAAILEGLSELFDW